MYFDIGFSLALLLSIIIGNEVKHNSWGEVYGRLVSSLDILWCKFSEDPAGAVC